MFDATEPDSSDQWQRSIGAAAEQQRSMWPCRGCGHYGYLAHTADAGRWRDVAAMHDDLARTLDFPGYYGRNLNAFQDMFRDVVMFNCGSDPTTQGTVLTLPGLETFHQREPDVAYALLDIFATEARMGLLVGHPMLCLVESTAVSFEKGVGGTPVMPVPSWGSGT